MIVQIVWGSLVLCLCTFLHLIVVLGWTKFLHETVRSEGAPGPGNWLGQSGLVGCTLLVIIAVHTIQVWLWAIALLLVGALASLSDAIYFALVTYTTVGYGDLTIEPDFRIFGAMAAVTGLLSFGISTALLVGVLTNVFPKQFG